MRSPEPFLWLRPGQENVIGANLLKSAFGHRWLLTCGAQLWAGGACAGYVQSVDCGLGTCTMGPRTL
jgi:hypothetical protein